MKYNKLAKIVDDLSYGDMDKATVCKELGMKKDYKDMPDEVNLDVLKKMVARETEVKYRKKYAATNYCKDIQGMPHVGIYYRNNKSVCTNRVLLCEHDEIYPGGYEKKQVTASGEISDKPFYDYVKAVMDLKKKRTVKMTDKKYKDFLNSYNRYTVEALLEGAERPDIMVNATKFDKKCLFEFFEICHIEKMDTIYFMVNKHKHAHLYASNGKCCVFIIESRDKNPNVLFKILI